MPGMCTADNRRGFQGQQSFLSRKGQKKGEDAYSP
jgi:hypothetical protein